MRGIGAILFLGWTHLAGASPSNAGQISQSAKIHIRLVDFVGLPEKIRVEAEGFVIRVFRDAGLEIDFVECVGAGNAAPCGPPGPAELWLQILKQAPHRPYQDAVGFTHLVTSSHWGDSYAAVSYPLVQETGRNLKSGVTAVLAISLAHEIGHLLLHSGAHSRSGVMSPYIDHRQIQLLERGELRFTSDQAARMRNRLEQLTAAGDQLAP
jgi:hypothetical protein